MITIYQAIKSSAMYIKFPLSLVMLVLKTFPTSYLQLSHVYLFDKPKHKYRLGREWIKSTLEEKDLGDVS